VIRKFLFYRKEFRFLTGKLRLRPFLCQKQKNEKAFIKETEIYNVYRLEMANGACCCFVRGSHGFELSYNGV